MRLSWLADYLPFSKDRADAGLDFFLADGPKLSRPMSQACTASQFREDVYNHWCNIIREPPRPHRKQWEFCYILQALDYRGMLKPGYRAVGFGVGKEPLAAVFASKGVRIDATDLDTENAQRAGWTNTNEHAAELAALNTRGICDPDAFAKLVRFSFADMNHLPDNMRGYDFCWSSCALEHLGSIKNSLAFIRNSLQLLRPGGIAVHTTELKCDPGEDTIDHNPTVLLRESDFRKLQKTLRAQGHHIECDFRLGDEELDKHIDMPPYNPDVHLKLQLEGFVTTSFGLIIQKAG
jgi:SAM-dependent methyltransferase